MASCITPAFGSSSCPQLRLTVTETSSAATTSILTWKLEYVAHGYAFSTSVAKKYTAVIGGAAVASGTYDINGKTGTYTITSGTKTINKTTAAQSIPFSCSMDFNAYWGSVYGGTKSASGSIGVAAKTSYTISYNANGGSGEPGSQTKLAGTNITLSTVQPTRTGYTFAGWATSTGGSVAYQPGATYSSNASVTLYAKWTALTYTVSYNANGGTGAPGDQTKTYGTSLTLSSAKPIRTNYTFKGWGTSAGSTTVAYASGASYTDNAAITLYAIWELAYTAPRITNLTVDRCNSSGTLSEEGTYALVKFDWETDKTVSSITLKYKQETSSTWTSTTVTASGTSGSVTKILSSGQLSTEYSYDIQIIVSDANGSNVTNTALAPISYIIDFLNGGKGTAFGKPATTENLSEFAWPVKMNSTLDVVGKVTAQENMTVNGWGYFKNSVYDKFNKRINNGLCMYASAGIDPNTTLDELILTNHANNPVSGKYFCIRTMFYNTKSASTNRVQYAVPYAADNSMYYRFYFNSTWSAWKRLVNADDLGDYVVAQGTSGIWKYQKWNSGKAECWISSTASLGNVNCTTASPWGGYESNYIQLVDYPFPFTNYPLCHIDVVSMDVNTAGDYEIIYRGMYTDNNSAELKIRPREFKFWRGSSKTFGHPLVTCYAVGNWK